ncbi:MAG TPA: DinB family protein [Chitinophagaceae bacterium]
MKITNLIATHVTEVYEGNNWTDVNIADTIKDISWQQAQQKTAGSSNTIASLLHHLYYWNGIIMQRMKGETPVIPEVNGYDVETLSSEADWIALKERTHQSFVELAESVRSFPEEKLLENYTQSIPSSYYRNMQGIVEHAHYHLGQMVILKKLLQ